MATTRRESPGDHRPKDRRGLSPTATAHATKPASRPSSAAGSPDKAAVHKSTPSYLRPTASSRHDSAVKPTKKPAPPAAPETATAKNLTRIKSMEIHAPAAQAPAHHPRVQTSGSLKERAGVKSTPPATRTAVPASTARPTKEQLGPRGRGSPSSLKKKKEPPPVVHGGVPAPGSPSGNVHGVLETRSEPDMVVPTAKLTLEDEEELVHGGGGGDLDHGASVESIPVSSETEKPQEHGDPHHQFEEHGRASEDHHQEEPKPEMEHVKEDPRAVEEAKDHNLGRLKTLSHVQAHHQVNKGVVDDELQRKLRARQAWEVDKEGESVVEEKVVEVKEGGDRELKRQGTMGRKESSNNDVIEEAASKLIVEKRKNKVLALVGAFETVMSLQEPETPPHAKMETPRAAAGTSAFEREMHEEEEVQVTQLAEVETEASNEASNEEEEEEVVVEMESGAENGTYEEEAEAEESGEKGEEKSSENE